MQEIWKDINGYDGKYKVSNLGNVKNNREKIMKIQVRKDGYAIIVLSKNGIQKAHYIHSLVANAFISRPNGKEEINHIDANKANNRVDNLEWVTKRENHLHAVRMNLKPVCPLIGKRGKDCPLSKPVFQYTPDGKLVKIWSSRLEAAAYYHCDPNSITRCIHGGRKRLKGFVWKHD